MIRIYLARIIGERRWTQSDLVKATGIRPTTINEWYHEIIVGPNIDHIDKYLQKKSK